MVMRCEGFGFKSLALVLTAARVLRVKLVRAVREL